MFFGVNGWLEQREQRVRELLRESLRFIKSVKLVDGKERDAHGLEWPSSHYEVDVKKQTEVVAKLEALERGHREK
jgi:hypothetical protein